jgi:L-2,4-diaminobutyrate decarboxylase
MTKTNFDQFFLNNTADGLQSFQRLISESGHLLIDFYKQQTQVFNGKTPEEIENDIAALPDSSLKGEDPSVVLKEIMQKVVNNSIHVSHPASMAHLHCPPLVPAIAAELMIAVLNQSMDSWDQSSAATYLEEKMIRWLCQKLSLSDQADGTFTSGGTQSNYMGLLLARDHFCEKHWNWNTKIQGLPPESHKLRILCSENAHFTVEKSASQLGLGEQAVVKVKTDKRKRMDISSLKEEIKRLKSSGFIPICVVVTCGTTDFGSIDPVDKISETAAEHGLWLHMDAAYGGAVMLSEKHRGKLQGIEKADSITVDFHKLFYQPISCGAFFVKDKRCFRHLTHHADYLNPEKEDLPHLVNKSVQTTRRFDALKLYMSLRLVGEKNFSDMIDHTIRLAEQTAELMKQIPGIELSNSNPELNAVVFRFKEGRDPDELNMYIYKKVLHSGLALMAKTKVNGQVFLKFTLLNPRTTIKDMEGLFHSLIQFAEEYNFEGVAK